MTGEQKPGGLEVERKAELYDHMKAVAEANGFQSLTEAIARATAAEAKLARAVEGLKRIGIYGCGMLNQPAAMNGPNEQWLERRIAEYEREARQTLAALQQEGE